jgi:hypothetical protein
VLSMTKLLLPDQLISSIIALLYDYAFKCDSRRDISCFSRIGKIGFTNLMLFMLNFLHKSMQQELDDFFKLIGHEISTITQQAFSQARKKVKAEAFIKMFKVSSHLMSNVTDLTLFKAYRISAIDGTSISLENTLKLFNYFGVSGSGGKAVTARASIIYDSLNDIIIDAKIVPYSTGERELAKHHIDVLCQMGLNNDLVIFDRGYPSAELIAFLISHNVHFLMRVPRSFNLDINDASAPFSKVIITYDGHNYVINVIKFLLSSGEVEMLITDIADQSFTLYDWKKLYFMRWSVETKYDTLKNKLQLENFSGKTVLAVLQDFYASIFLLNVVATFKYVSDSQIENKNKMTDNKLDYQTNVNQMIGVMKNDLVCIFMQHIPFIRHRMFIELIATICKKKSSIRPNRQYPRSKVPSRLNYPFNAKSNL